MFGSNKHIFWQALVVALVIFWSGILLGVWFEEARIDKSKQLFYDSETNIFDIMLQGQILTYNNFSCELIKAESIVFADKVYEEARQLEKYDASNKITEDALRLHKRYDLMRTLLWSNLIDGQKRCKSDINTVVYLYQYKEPSVDTQARQATMSKVLLDLKKKYTNDIILIPIAYDSEIKSLDYLMVRYNLDKEPTIFINQQYKIKELVTLEQLERYLWE